MLARLGKYARVFGWLLNVRLSGRKVPFMLEYQINRKCNMACKYCYADLESLEGVAEPSLEEIKSNIDQFHRLGTRVLRILGGEPLLREDIGEIIRHVSAKGMFVEMSTNGTMIPKKAEDLKGLDILQISIDGSRKATDAVRGEGVYDRVIKGLEAAKAHGLPARLHGVYNSFSLDADDASPVAHLAELSRRYDVPFNFCPFVADFSGEVKDAYVSLERLHPYHMECLEYRRKGYKYFNSEVALRQLIEWPDPGKDFYMDCEAEDLPRNVMRCLAGDLYCFLDSDGSLYPCVPLWKRGLNIHEVGVEAAWKHLATVRAEAGCYTCASLGDMEFSRTLALDARSMINTLRKVTALGK